MSTRRRKQTRHRLTRPETIRKLWIAFIAVLALTLAPNFFMHPHAAFGVDGTFGFGAWFGFGACVALIVFAKLLGILLKRRDTYYDE
ncbi:MAG TPA: hypothetical protein VGA00_01145 [Acidiferrobacterales bacterium]|jgi:hypothetical protein